MNKTLFALLLGLMHGSASLAHEGHGMDGSHWHATDSLGFVMAAVIVLVMVWLGRK